MRLSKLITGGALTALAFGALTAPVGAADTTGTLAIVNGVPGKRVDVCINDAEIKSGLAYGKAVLRDAISTGEKILDFYEPDPRTCKGHRIAHHDGIGLDAGDDLTIVVTRRAPKIVIFDNAGFGEIPPAGAPLPSPVFIFHSAADVDTNLKVTYSIPVGDIPLTPSADPVWTKGDSYGSAIDVDTIFRLRATLPGKSKAIAQSPVVTLDKLRRYEWILLGSNKDDARILVLVRRASQPTP